MKANCVSLAVALAWVHTRDHKFCQIVSESGCWPIESEFEKFGLRSNRKYFPHTATVHDAWNSLIQAARGDGLEISGIPSVRTNEPDGNGGMIWKPSNRAMQITGGELLFHFPEPIIQQPKGLTHIRLSEVEVNKSKLELLFTEKPMAFAAFETPALPTDLVKLTKVERRIAASIKALWGQRDILESVEVRNGMISEWMTHNIDNLKTNPRPISSSSIRRFFLKYPNGRIDR